MLGEIAPKIHGNIQQGGWFLIQKALVSTAASTITISNIPPNFNHLKIIGSGSVSDAAVAETIAIRFNGDTGANYYYQYAQGNGATLTGGSSNASYVSVGVWPGASAAAHAKGTFEVLVPDYSYTSSYYKSYQAEGGFSASSGTFLLTSCGTWDNSAAINSVTLYDAGGGNLVAGTQLYLYGVY